MTMLSFRVPEEDAAEAQAWAARLGVERSELLRQALRRHLVALRSQLDGERWELEPLTPEEASFVAVADWGPAEEWSDWSDAIR